jgi:glutamyl-tRNA synthetase
MNKIRVRFAPSPTGLLHVGALRSALYNYLFSKKNKGAFILRLEDTDRKRYVPESVGNIIRTLNWAGLKYDEGIYLEGKKIAERGKFGPYIQSRRLEIYQKYAKELINQGKAYYCFCDPARLAKMREEQVLKKQAPMYDRYCLENLSTDEIEKKLEEKCPATIRLKIERGGTVEFDDIIRGKVSFKSDLIDDQVLLKSDGYPTYHLASVVDDHLMKISHVIRGEEWLSSAPKHILLYKAFGWTPPEFAHLPLLLNTKRKKLSKRDGDVSVEDYIKKGYLKDAIINFVALLGWNPGRGETQEIFSLEELVGKFDLGNVNKAGAVFDLQKLDWINSQYIKKLSIDELCDLALPFLEKKEFYHSWNTKRKTWNKKEKEKYLKKVLTIEQERIVNLAGVGESNKFFFCDPTYEKELLRWKKMSDAEIKNNLLKAKNVLENIPEEKWEKEFLKKELLDAAGEKRGEFLWPFRVALTGEQKSPPPDEVAWVLEKSATLKRIGEAIKLF